MALFNVYQINFSDAQVKMIRASGPKLAFYQEYLDTIDFPTSEAILKAQDQYQIVAQIEAHDLEDVYRISNLGIEKNIKRLAPMHSLSVGDVVVGEDNIPYYVDTFGFKEATGFVPKIFGA